MGISNVIIEYTRLNKRLHIDWRSCHHNDYKNCQIRQDVCPKYSKSPKSASILDLLMTNCKSSNHEVMSTPKISKHHMILPTTRPNI